MREYVRAPLQTLHLYPSSAAPWHAAPPVPLQAVSDAGKMVEWDGERWIDTKSGQEVDPLGR